MPRAQLDPALSVRVLGVRELRYSDAGELGDDRPAHVRAASGLALAGGRLAVIQDDCAFIGYVSDQVTALPLPRGANGRRRFESALGNKADKLDLEACVVVAGELGDELWAFGSGSTPMREKIAVVGLTTRLHDGAPLYRRLREELSGPSAASSQGTPSPVVNLEGACVVGNELWLFHRGNTGPHDVGPMVFRLAKPAFGRWLAADGALPAVDSAHPYELGDIDGVRLGFTDAVAVGARVFYLAAAEASPNAIDDGAVLASQLGVIDGERVRAAPLVIDGAPAKAEGLAFDPEDPRHAWIAIDPDDVDAPARLYEVELVGPW